MSDNINTFVQMGFLQISQKTKECLVEPVEFTRVNNKKLLLLDMDETLLHAATLDDIFTNQVYGQNAQPTFITSFNDNGVQIQIGVFVRPFLAELLQGLAPIFDICIYTASEQVYANSILDTLDPHGAFLQQRLYRDKCTRASVDNGQKQIFLKDLRCIEGYPIEDIVIVDNSLLSFALQPENGVPISSFFNDPEDQELKCLLLYLQNKVYPAEDVRDVNRDEFKL